MDKVKEKGKVEFYVGQLTIVFYYPHVWLNSSDYGLNLATGIIGKRHVKYQEWWITRSVVIRVLGFGIGLAWNHIDNPNQVIKSTD